MGTIFIFLYFFIFYFFNLILFLNLKHCISFAKPFLKSLLNLLEYYFCFRFFGHKACEILAPRPGMELTSAALEREVLTIGSPGKSLC